MKRRTLLGSLIVGALLAGCAPVLDKSAVRPNGPAAGRIVARATSADGTIVVRLENGLTAIVKPMRTTPVVCVRAYVRAGGLYEREWLGCGLSHLCEHLLAKESIHEMPGGGAPHSPREKRSRTLDIGGQSNAYTSLGHTCYYIAAAASKAFQCVDLIADQVSRPDITSEDFRREHGVVTRELERGRDNPARRMQYAHAANIFGAHPAAVPVIGYAKPLSTLTRDDVLAYAERMYVPQNTVFVVVGDVDATAVLKRITERFAGFERGRAPDLSLPEVPKLTGVRRRTITGKTVRDTIERLSFQTIPLIHEDLYALDALSFILSRGQSSRLVRSLKFEKRLVTSIRTSSWTPAWGTGFFTVAFRAEPDRIDAAEEAILDELRAVVEEGVTDEQLATAKRQKLAELVYSRQTAESVAVTLAWDYLSTSNVEFSRDYTAKIQQVSAEDVRRVAAKYFTFDRMAITRMVPESLAVTAAKVEKVARPETTLFELPNGLRVILHPAPVAGLVSMAFVTTGGVLIEDDKTNGLGSLMAAMSVRGAGERSADEIAAFFDAAGGEIAGNCGNNSFYWEATVLEDRFDGALEILADVIQRPTFAKKELEAIRPLAGASIKQVDERMDSQLSKFFRRKFFDSPYRMLPSGSLEVVDSTTVEQIAAWHKKNVGVSNSVLAIYGNFDAPITRERIAELFDTHDEHLDEAIGFDLRHVAPESVHILPTKHVQAGVIVAVPGMKISNTKDCLPIKVLDTIISGYRLPSGWLHTELRGKQLVYAVHAYNWAGLCRGAFIARAGCQPEKALEVVEIIRKNLDKAADYSPTQKEIDRAVNVIITADALDSQSMSSQAISSALDELYGLGYDFRKKAEKLYRKITPADVQRVAKKYLGQGYVVIVTTPKPEAFKNKNKNKQ